MQTIPIVIEQSNRGDRAYDIWSRLMKDRIIFVNDSIDDHSANIIIAQLLFLSAEDSKRDINMYINSPGGIVTAGLAIYDTMKIIKCPISTTCVGLAASMASIILSAGTKGKRKILQNSTVMIHQPLTGVYGQVTDVEIVANHAKKVKTRLAEILSQNTGKDISKVQSDCERDYYMDAQQAVDYGIVDIIIGANK